MFKRGNTSKEDVEVKNDTRLILGSSTLVILLIALLGGGIWLFFYLLGDHARGNKIAITMWWVLFLLVALKLLPRKATTQDLIEKPLFFHLCLTGTIIITVMNYYKVL